MAEMWISMGPQHPMTHGLWTLKVKVDGETITDADPELGYLHRSVEKMGERRKYFMNTTLTSHEIRSLALMNARQKHAGPGWGLLGLAGCGTGLMGGIIIGEVTESFPGFVLGGALGLSLPSLLASGTASSNSVRYYPAELKTQNGKQLYKDAYVKETGLLRRRSTLTGTAVGLLGFGAFMLVLISDIGF